MRDPRSAHILSVGKSTRRFVIFYLVVLAVITGVNLHDGVSAAPWWFYIAALLLGGLFWVISGLFIARGNWKQ